MLKGSASIQMMMKNLGKAAWKERELLAARFPEEKKLTELPTRSSSDAWLWVAIK